MPESSAVQRMFAGIAGRYDRANHWLSGGVDYYWRHRLVQAVAATQPAVVVDLATGSGDVAIALRRKLGPSVSLRGLDFCEPMLAEARQKVAARTQLAPIDFAFGDCLELPLADASVDALTIAFGLRNLADRARGLREMHRVLRPGGHLFVLEFTQPDAWFKPFYYLYLRHLLPHLATWLTSDRSAYEYLGDTIAGFPARPELSAEIRAAGFAHVDAQGLTAGIVALHAARK